MFCPLLPLPRHLLPSLNPTSGLYPSPTNYFPPLSLSYSYSFPLFQVWGSAGFLTATGNDDGNVLTCFRCWPFYANHFVIDCLVFMVSKIRSNVAVIKISLWPIRWWRYSTWVVVHFIWATGLVGLWPPPALAMIVQLRSWTISYKNSFKLLCGLLRQSIFCGFSCSDAYVTFFSYLSIRVLIILMLVCNFPFKIIIPILAF